MTTADNERRLLSVLQQIETLARQRDALSDDLARLHVERGNLEWAIKRDREANRGQ